MTKRMLNKENITKVLLLLGKQLDLEQRGPVSLVVCGGSSLIVTDLIARPTTKDVDVLGFLEKTPDGEVNVEPKKPFPEWLENAVRQVANDLGLDKNWLNPGPSDLVRFGLPLGLKERLIKMRFGNSLTVHFVGRVDIISLKVFAAADMGMGRHVEDLLGLKPTEEELETGAKWAMTQDPSEEFKEMIKGMLEALNFGKVAQRI